MWNTGHSARSTAQTSESPAPSPPAIEPALQANAEVLLRRSTIREGMVIRGELSGTDSLFIDGTVEGSVNLPGGRVTVGLNGRVEGGMNANRNVCITAREIVIMGSVHGDVAAADRVEIRAEGKLTGDVSTASISIADGGFFKGFIGVREAEGKREEFRAPDACRAHEHECDSVRSQPAVCGAIQTQTPRNLHWNEDGERTGGGFTSDVALDGALINSSKCPPVGSDVQIEVLIQSPAQDGEEMRVYCAGKVIRVMDRGDVMSFGVRGDFRDNHLSASIAYPSWAAHAGPS